jgi:hypothetical protein
MVSESPLDSTTSVASPRALRKASVPPRMPKCPTAPASGNGAEPPKMISLEGVHLIVQADSGKPINLHLGPEAALEEVVDQLSAGQQITFEAFVQTSCRQMPMWPSH